MRDRFRPVRNPGEELLAILANVLEYSIKDHRLIRISKAELHIVKAVSDKKGEFYFPLKPIRTRGGIKFQILSVLKRIDRSKPVLWNGNGQPVENLKVIDDMIEPTGKKWLVVVEGSLIEEIST